VIAANTAKLVVRPLAENPLQTNPLRPDHAQASLPEPCIMQVSRRRIMFAVRFILAFVALLFLSAPAASHAETTVRSVIAKVMQAYGGRDAVEKIKAVRAEGRIVAFAFDAEGTYSYRVAGGRKMRVDIDYGRFAEHRVLNGERAMVQQGEGGPEVLTMGPNYLSVLYQYAQLRLPWALTAWANRIRYEGQKVDNGRTMEVLTLDADRGLVVKIYVDAASDRIVKTSSAFRMGNAEMVLSSAFSDFREVGGTVLPFRFVNFAGGDKIAETTIDRYELNPPLADNVFAIPGADTQ